MNYLDAERKDLPSASGFHRIVHCAGSFALEKNIPSQSSKDAESGTRIHKALTEILTTGKTNISSLSEAEKKSFTDCFAQYQIALNHWKKTDNIETICEERLWFHDGETELMSGEYDVLALDNRRALIPDFKTGFGDYDDIAINWQMRCLAVFVWKNHPGVNEITVCLIQPNKSQNPTLCVYEEADLKKSHELILYHLEKSKKPDAKRTPGNHCFFCKAKTRCDESKLSIEKVYDPSNWMPKTPEDRSRRLDLFKLARKVMEEEEKFYAKILTEDPDAIPGYRVMVGRKQLMPRESDEAFVKEQKTLLKNKMIEEGRFEERFVFFEKPSLKRI